MSANIITIEDLNNFKKELLDEIRIIINEKKSDPETTWIKSGDVCKLLNISSGTLQSLRKNGTIPFKKMGGTIYYKLNDIKEMMSE